MKFLFLFVILLPFSIARTVTFTNKCRETIWINPSSKGNNGATALTEGIGRVDVDKSFAYRIPANGWNGQFWPKVSCDDAGQNCVFGQSVAPCKAVGCDPPAETKVVFNFPPVANKLQGVAYEVNLVDGFTMSATVEPIRKPYKDSCSTLRCGVSLNGCPRNETDGLGDLIISRITGRSNACFSPCRKWTYVEPFGMNRNANAETGLSLCCQDSSAQSAECRAGRGRVSKTKYVDAVRRFCPSGRALPSDKAAVHNCPNDTNFSVTFC